MNEQAFFHWDLIRQPLQPPAFGMGASFLDFRYTDFGGDPGEGMNVGTRILELRKEKSRDAARSRRGKENYEFYELAKLLPLPAAITSQLDKASIIRLSISYLKLREFSGHGDPPWNRDYLSNSKSLKGHGRRRNAASVAMDIFDNHQGTHILQSLDGFAFILANDGRFLYISETVSIYLGLSQVEMTGSSIFDYVHVQDHSELVDQLGLGISHGGSSGVPSPGSQSDEGSAPSTPRCVTPPTPDRATYMLASPDKGMERTFCVRMKSTLTKRGVHVRTSGYRVVYIVGHLRPQMCFNIGRKGAPQILGMVGLAIALPPPTITELRIESDTFIMRLSPDFNIVYCDPAISELMDWSSEELPGKTLYDLCHAGDLVKLRKTHQDLLGKGQVLSEYYRLMNRNGGYVWVQTCATTLFSSKTSDVHTVLAIIYVLSGVEYGGCVMNTIQTVTNKDTESNKSDLSMEEHDIDESMDKELLQTSVLSPRPDSESNGSLSDQSSCLKESEDKLLTNDEELNNNLLEQDSVIQNNSKQSPIVFDNSVNEETTAAIVANLDEKIKALKNEYKNSRRKNERPRKRKRDSDVEDEDSNDKFVQGLCSKLSHQDIENSSLSMSLSYNSTVSPRLHSHSRCSNSDTPECLDDVSQSLAMPEDLSLRTVDVQPISSRESHSRHLPSRSTSWHGTSTTHDDCGTPSSVKDLEEVMNKHLPNISSGTVKTTQRSPSGASDLASSPRSLPQSLQINKHRSAIQWTGTSPEGETLPASNLLRSLYANRESVIRTSSRGHCFNTDSNPLNMLTPPGGEGLKEQLTLNIPQITVNNKGTVLPSFSGSEHLATDSYNITPPSSVSPDNKVGSPFAMEATFDPNSVICNSSTSATVSSPIPVKSQTFSLSLGSSPVTEYNCGKGGGYGNFSTYPVTDYTHYLHNGNSSSVVVYDTRQEAWYPMSFPS
ncbi:hypothetical protein FSP39_002413 [Pinctada imbricata]|uniref:Uncharacterized protein n=1 Tax=Pinctada imbricata TaxID=66713 RepID=A0AA88XXZ3_PINIB|nr:hypothetical protein FSP39_002413 [Pinctada imbricata]